LQTLQPSAKTKGLVGSHGQINHHGKDLKSKQKTQSIQGKIQVFEDKTSNTGPKKNMVEDRGVQTDPIELEESKSKTAGIYILFQINSIFVVLMLLLLSRE
jgi:hypothetical protein